MTQPAQAREPAVEERFVGGYRLLALIGEGGMGVVHLARGDDGRRVALKVLRPHVVGDREARERLAREVSSLRLVHSPRVAEVLDADPHGPTPYVATRYVPGLSLHEHVREEGPLEGVDLLHFARCLTEALIAVHEVDVLHRDVKPSNVLMEGRSPVLIDFGLARLAEDPRLTHTGWLLGTPGYLAPEILYGDDATAASDVHSWAATVVFAATGRAPYGKGPAMAVLDRVRRGEHDLRGVPEPLAGLLREALSPEPLDRPGLHEIHVWLRTEQATASGAARRDPAEDSWTRPVVALRRPAPTVVGSGVGVGRLDPDPFAPDDLDRLETTRLPREAPGAATQSPPPSDPFDRDFAGDFAGDFAHERATDLVEPAPYTQALPRHDPLPAGIDPVGPDGAPFGSPRRRRVQLVGLGAVLATALAVAPYAVVLASALLVLLLRATSIGRERHGRRQVAHGRARWYDVPVTTLASPGYVVLSLAGSVLLVGWAVAASVAFGVVESIAKPPLALGMVLLGAVFALSLWWGPGAPRLREVVVRGVDRAGEREVTGPVLLGLCVVAVLALGVVVAGTGPTWAPASEAPWSDGFLAAVARHL